MKKRIIEFIALIVLVGLVNAGTIALVVWIVPEKRSAPDDVGHSFFHGNVIEGPIEIERPLHQLKILRMFVTTNMVDPEPGRLTADYRPWVPVTVTNYVIGYVKDGKTNEVMRVP